MVITNKTMRWIFFLVTSIQLTYCKVILRPTVELDWWQNAIIYEIFPLSFKDSDGDGSGDFKGTFYYDNIVTHIYFIIVKKKSFFTNRYNSKVGLPHRYRNNHNLANAIFRITFRIWWLRHKQLSRSTRGFWYN